MSELYSPWRSATQPRVKPEPANVNWSDPDAVWVYKKVLFKNLQIEVQPTVFVPYEPHKGQAPVHFPLQGEEWDVYVAAAGQRAGKSLTAAAEIVARLGQPGQRMWICAPNYDLTRRVYEMVHEFAVGQEIHGRHSVERASNPTAKESLTIKMRWGSWVSTKSCENPDSLVGEKLTFLVLDEAAQVGEEIWTDYLEPRLVNLKGKALMISSPRGHNWFWRYHQRGQSDKGRALGWRSGHFKTEDNPYVDRDFLRQKKLLLPKLVYAQEYEGSFVSKQGLVYDDYMDALKPEGHLYDPDETEIGHNWTHYLAVDVGIRHPTAAVYAAVDPMGNVWVYDEYHQSGGSHQDHARGIAAKLRHQLTQGWISVDAARTDQLTPDTAISARDVYGEAGLHLYPAHRDVNAGVSLVQKYMRSALAAPRATTHPRIYISKECRHLRKGLLSYMWVGRRGTQNEDTKTDLPEKPRKWDDDMVDALRYLIAGRPGFVSPRPYDEQDDYDPQGREGFRRAVATGYVRPGVDYA